MVHCAQLVAVVKVQGQVMREVRQSGSDVIYLPFGSEYEIEFQNLSSKRAAVTVEVDGEVATGGHKLVIDANSRGNLQGALDGNGVVAHNRFKFIKMNDKIEQARGIDGRDGLIRISWQYEKPYVPPYTPPYRPPYIPRRRWDDHDTYRGILRSKNLSDCGGFKCCAPNMGGGGGSSMSAGPSSGMGSGLESSMDAQIGAADVQSFNDSWQDNDKGITVAGSVVDQQFGTTYLRELEAETHVIVFELRGTTKNGAAVARPRTVRAKVACPTCKTNNASHDKFCRDCGTCLV